MLRIVVNTSAAGAKSYYSTADYYKEGQELAGTWHGIGAGMLDLTGNVEQRDWNALCDNRNPATGGTLTARRKESRRVGYDFNFHAPKSVSLLHALTQDERLAQAFRSAVSATMRDMEAEMHTRVRACGKDEDRVTGNMAWGEFVHTTARPVDGIPDPHLHAHCFVFNTTWDDQELRWKAGQFVSLKRDAPYFEALFQSRLARGMNDLGLAVERTRTGWEIEGFERNTLAKFARRTALIEAEVKRRDIRDAKSKGALGAKTRERKQKELGMSELRQTWRSRMSEGELAVTKRVAERIGGSPVVEDRGMAMAAVSRSVEHCFERASVVPERTLLAHAIKNAAGAATPHSVKALVAQHGLIHAERDGRKIVTTHAVLNEERKLVAFARDGRGICAPLAPNHVFTSERLNTQQRTAVTHILESRDRVTLLRGGAGTGKTTLALETVDAIKRAGHRVVMVAPSAEASRGVLRREGFEGADTVSRLLVDEAMQKEARGEVIWVDEASLLGVRSMAQLFDLAARLDARLVIAGDRAQHGSVERGAALRLLEEEAGVVPATVREIQRQRGAYRDAVRSLSEGNTERGFRRLDRMGWIREAPDDERYARLADAYAETVAIGKSALVVSPTHRECEAVSQAIRERLKASGTIRGKEHSLMTLEPVNWTEGERADSVNYQPGDVLVFHQNARRFTKGQRVVLGETDAPPVSQAARFQVYRWRELAVAAGDTIRVTRNGTTADGAHRLNNGATYAVKRFDKRGNLVLANGWTIDKDFGHLEQGYAVTSQASQGRTVDRTFVALSSESFPAASREGFYVAASRAREQTTVFTDHRQELLRAVSQSEAQLTATELVRSSRSRGERTTVLQSSARHHLHEQDREEMERD